MMHKLVLKIGDKEYDTGSFISTDTPMGEDWGMIAGMVSEFVNFQMDEEAEE